VGLINPFMLSYSLKAKIKSYHDAMIKILKLPPRGKALIITDLHGNKRDFLYYESLWKKYLKKGHQVILTGDLIHSLNPEYDYSIEMLDSVQKYCEDDNFHLLLGNHEWCHISEENIYKSGINQKKGFEELLYDRFGDEWERELKNYIKFFQKLPLAAKTNNQIIISHAGPPKDFTDLDELKNPSYQDYLHKEKLLGLLWPRMDDFKRRNLELFLEYNDACFHVVGHTPVNGYQVIYDRQLIISSSMSEGRKAYLELDLEMEIKHIDELVGMVRLLDRSLIK
jgi:serine/threonine-protein phosphatase PP1 catalytic subunit